MTQFEAQNAANDMEDEARVKTEHSEIPDHTGEAEKLERDLGLGVQRTPKIAGMPSAEGGGLTGGIGHSHPETDPN